MTQRSKVLLAMLLFGVAISVPGSAEQTIKREGEPDVVSVDEADPNMARAIRMAQESLDSFIQRLQSPSASQGSAYVKARFTTQDGGEHIWLDNPTYDNGSFSGVVGNTPLDPGIKLGDRVRIVRSDISDWMIVDGACLRGAFTVRAVRDSLSREEQKRFDSNLETPLCP